LHSKYKALLIRIVIIKDAKIAAILLSILISISRPGTDLNRRRDEKKMVFMIPIDTSNPMDSNKDSNR